METPPHECEEAKLIENLVRYQIAFRGIHSRCVDGRTFWSIISFEEDGHLLRNLLNEKFSLNNVSTLHEHFQKKNSQDT